MPPLASGQRPSSVARKLSDDFFRAFRQHLTARTEAPPAAVAEAAPAPAAVAEAGAAAAAAPAPRAPAAPRPAPANTGPVMVPGWWLLVAAVTGAAISLVSVHFHR